VVSSGEREETAMDSEAIPSTATTTAPAAPGTPLRMDTVVVFGDSLSDIGKKWKTTSGKTAIKTNQMYVSPTGRFSDCRNWTDFMFEAATGATMIADTPTTTIAISERFTSLSYMNPVLNQAFHNEAFQYANYAEGGACGDTPASLSADLGTFKEQVDAFQKDYKALQRPLGNTLFIVWFGANDLYTAGRKAAEMPQVATQIASTQRQCLAEFVKGQNQATLGADLAKNCVCKFIFVDLCRPLSSVRYTKLLNVAEAKVKTVLGTSYVAAAPKWGLGSVPQGGVFRASHTLQLATSLGYQTTSKWWQRAGEVELLHVQIEAIKNLENGVLLFNSTLKKTADQNGDGVVEIGKCVSEHTIRELVQGNYRLKAGAMGAAVTTHISAASYNQGASVQHTHTFDEVHPTDQMYRLIWLEIYEQIKRSKCTFGRLSPVIADTPPPLAELHEAPMLQTKQAFAAVMADIRERRID
jgi:phospholipase/lecithinase/hemolysin